MTLLKNPFNRPTFLSNVAYLCKCLIGVVICYILYREIPQYPFYWAIVSVVIALSPDNSSKQAFNRIKANILGCAIGISLYPLHLPNLVILCIGIILTICIGLVLNFNEALRSAMAALIIVTIQVEEGKHWYIALERVGCVVTGCVVALLITMLFNLKLFDQLHKSQM
jgi:uncharacterized membrane protein YccC|eukprot:gene5041-5090_t